MVTFHAARRLRRRSGRNFPRRARNFQRLLISVSFHRQEVQAPLRQTSERLIGVPFFIQGSSISLPTLISMHQ